MHVIWKRDRRKRAFYNQASATLSTSVNTRRRELRSSLLYPYQKYTSNSSRPLLRQCTRNSAGGHSDIHLLQSLNLWDLAALCSRRRGGSEEHCRRSRHWYEGTSHSLDALYSASSREVRRADSFADQTRGAKAGRKTKPKEALMAGILQIRPLHRDKVLRPRNWTKSGQ